MRPDLSAAVFTLAASFAFALPLAADPAPMGELPQRTVRLDDLDLSRDADLSVLYARIRAAVSDLCPAPAGDVARHARGLICRREVLQRAVERFGDPRLAELHRGGGSHRHLARR